MWKTNGTVVTLGFIASFGCNSTTFKTIRTSVQFLLSLAADGEDSEKRSCASNFAAGVIAANNIMVDSISRSEGKTTSGSGGCII